ncbi:hypothetical protein C3V36_10265 [Lachnospiraceae bacterium oral taxon 500]|nr:hypothetical protein C3V36_10265 [Lachnospiraceae bacterium oral taxon 500]
MRYYKFDQTELFSRRQRFYSAAVNARRVSLGCAAFCLLAGQGACRKLPAITKQVKIWQRNTKQEGQDATTKRKMDNNRPTGNNDDLRAFGL